MPSSVYHLQAYLQYYFTIYEVSCTPGPVLWVFPQVCIFQAFRVHQPRSHTQKPPLLTTIYLHAHIPGPPISLDSASIALSVLLRPPQALMT